MAFLLFGVGDNMSQKLTRVGERMFKQYCGDICNGVVSPGMFQGRLEGATVPVHVTVDRKSTRLNSSHLA